jgi:hypothetical protein
MAAPDDAATHTVYEEHQGVARVGLSEGIFTYTIPDTELAHGTSLGNAHAWATSKGTGAIQGLFSTDVGEEVTGSLVVNFFAPYRDLLLSGRMDEQGRQIGAETLVRLAHVGVGRFAIHPAYQAHSFDLVGDLRVTETFFLPNTGFDDEAAAIQVVEIQNFSSREQTLAAIGCLDLPGRTAHDMVAHYDRGLGAIVAWNRDDENWVRVFGVVPHPDAYLVSHDIEEAWSPTYPLANKDDETGGIVASLQETLFLRPGEKTKLSFIVAFSAEGRKKAAKLYRGVGDYEK